MKDHVDSCWASFHEKHSSFRHWHRLHEPDSKESRDLAKVYDLAVLPKAKLDDWKKRFPFVTNTRLETNTAPKSAGFQ